MNNLLCFVLGVMVGGSVGVAFMCCFQLNRMNKLNEQIASLQAELNKMVIVMEPYEALANRVISFTVEDYRWARKILHRYPNPQTKSQRKKVCCGKTVYIRFSCLSQIGILAYFNRY